MLTDLHTTFQRLLYERGKIAPEQVDIRFDMPTKEWVASLTRPTLSLYLFDLKENTELRYTSVETMRANGRAVHRMPPRRFDLHYLVSALTTSVADEQTLIWRALATLLKHAELPAELLAEPLRGVQPALIGQVSKPDDDKRLLDLWSAFELPPRPALLYIVTAPLDLEFEFSSPLVLTRTVRYTRSTPSDEAAGQGISPERITQRDAERAPLDGVAVVHTSIQIGGVLRDAAGAPVPGATVSAEGSAASSETDEQGRFRLDNLRPGPLQLRITRAGQAPTIIPLAIPADSYDVSLD